MSRLVTAVDLARKFLPTKLRYRIQRVIPLTKLKEKWRAQSDPLSDVRSGTSRNGRGPKALIVQNSAQYHTQFVAACQEMGLAFEVVDLLRADWLATTKSAKPDFVLFWPEAVTTPRLNAMKDRVTLLESVLGLQVVPGSHEVWPYEDKRRMWYWLQAHRIKHPSTHVFFDPDQALEFARNCPLPVVHKTAFGAAASGVKILRERKAIERSIRRAFRRGHLPDGMDLRDREWGFIIFQDFIPILREWRMVRIGDAFFGHPKGQAGDFHSGSGVVHWDRPPNALLDLLHEVTEQGKFRSMNVDIFETEDGDYLVNELQAVFGAGYSVDQLRVDGEPGRMVRTQSGTWHFEQGDFARNMCANARIEDVIARLDLTRDQTLKARG